MISAPDALVALLDAVAATIPEDSAVDRNLEAEHTI